MINVKSLFFNHISIDEIYYYSWLLVVCYYYCFDYYCFFHDYIIAIIIVIIVIIIVKPLLQPDESIFMFVENPRPRARFFLFPTVSRLGMERSPVMAGMSRPDNPNSKWVPCVTSCR